MENLKQCLCKILIDNFGAYSKKYFEILQEMSKHKLFDLSEIAKNTNCAFKMITDLVKIFESEFIQVEKDKYTLANELLAEVQKLSKEYEKQLNFDYQKAVEKYQNYTKNFLADKVNLDHISATCDTAIDRAIYLIKNYDIKNIKIAMLGDHDFTSIALKILCKDCDVTVFDVDRDVLNFVHDFDCDIKTTYADFRFGIHNQFNDMFDLLFTDPPYTANGMDCFLKNAKNLCKKNIYSSIICSYYCGDLSIKNGLNVQKTILNNGLYIESIEHKFNKYNFAESLGYCSDLYCFRMVNIAWTKNSLKLDNVLNIYTHGIMSNESLYKFEELNNLPKLTSSPASDKDINIFTAIKSTLNSDNFNLPDVVYLSNFQDYSINFVQFLLNLNFKTLYFRSKQSLENIVDTKALKQFVDIFAEQNGVYKLCLKNNVYSLPVSKHYLTLKNFVKYVSKQEDFKFCISKDVENDVVYKKYCNDVICTIPYDLLFSLFKTE